MMNRNIYIYFSVPESKCHSNEEILESLKCPFKFLQVIYTTKNFTLGRSYFTQIEIECL